ncbi:MAG: RnfABCDGE type electron transport complex subunit G [Bacteroidales bacterium]|nr:RnfABCDGE type electron transport complex subunit G [Bacteroidales bacterium]
MAAKSTLGNMALCLTAVCLLCSAILGVVYAVTFEPIKAAARANLEQSLSEVVPQGCTVNTDADSREMEGVEYQCYEAVDAEGNPCATAVSSTVNGFGGSLTVLVGVMRDGSVCATKVLSHSETPGLGAKCEDSSSAFVKQFEGFDPSVKKLSVRKDGGDVDAITASTITSRAYTLAIENAVKLMKKKEADDE